MRTSPAPLSADACTPRPHEFPQHLTRTTLGPIVDMRPDSTFDWQAAGALDAPEKLPAGGSRAFNTTVGTWVCGFGIALRGQQ